MILPPSDILIKIVRPGVMKEQTFLLCDFINNFCFGMDNDNIFVLFSPVMQLVDFIH